MSYLICYWEGFKICLCCQLWLASQKIYVVTFEDMIFCWYFCDVKICTLSNTKISNFPDDLIIYTFLFLISTKFMCIPMICVIEFWGSDNLKYLANWTEFSPPNNVYVLERSHHVKELLFIILANIMKI